MAAATDPRSKVCIHCGTPFEPNPVRPDFCCAGCQFVHNLISKNGLSQFYELQDSAIFPVKSLVFQKRDYTWLAALAEQCPESLQLDLQGVSCIGCVWLIEKLFDRQPGALAIHMDTALGRLQWRVDADRFDPVAFARELQNYGYLLGPLNNEGKPARSTLVIRLGVCAALAMNAMLFTLPSYLGMAPGSDLFALFRNGAFVCGTLSFLVGGSYFLGRSLQSLRARVLHIDLPISLGLIAAYAGSLVAWRAGADGFVYFDFVSMFTFLMLVGRWVQQAAVEKNRRRLLGAPLNPLQPQSGDRFQIGSGQVIPVRSKLLSRGASLGLEWINGESEARSAVEGGLIPSGALNLSQHPIELEALEHWKDSILARLLEVQPREITRHTGLEKFIRIYILAVLAVGVAAFCGWLSATGDLLRSLQVLTSILVVSCPCAAGVALPLAEEIALSGLRKIGVFVREPSLWTRLARVKQIVFDKTGTLTLETMAIRNPEELLRLDPETRRTLLGMVNDNLHPVSCCLREHLLSEMEAPGPSPAPREVVGTGLELQNPAGLWRLGRPGWAGNAPLDADCVLTRDGKPLASLRFGEETRTGASEEMAQLTRHGFSLHILSGDRQAKVDAMAERLGLPKAQCHGAFSPEEKAAWLRSHHGARTLMIGDGANDSLAFNESLCTGTPAIDRGLLEQKADFYFLGRGLQGVRRLFDVAAARRRATFGVLGFAVGYNLVAIGLCIVGWMTPLAASVLMPLSSLATLGIVALSLRTVR
jgi:Cu2+-exporting ATPase